MRRWAPRLLLAALCGGVFCPDAMAGEGGTRWSVTLSPRIVPIVSGDVGSGEDVPEYSDAFRTGRGIALGVEMRVSKRAALVAEVGYERHDGRQFQGFSFGNLEVVPIYVGGIYRFPIGSQWALCVNARVGTVHLSAVDLSLGALRVHYWESSWTLSAGAGAAVEYRVRGPWSAALQAEARSLGRPESAFGAPSDATSSVAVPISLTVRYSR